MSRFGAVIAALLWLVAAGACIRDGGSGGTEDAGHVRVGDTLPLFKAETPGGSRVDALQLKGKVGLVVFFSTACPDCRRELPHMETVWQALGGNEAFRLMPIAREEPAERVAAYWEEEGFGMPYYLDPRREAYALFAERTIPRAYLTDGRNRVVWTATERLETDGEGLVEKIKGLISALP